MTMNKIQVVILVVGLALCTFILAYPPVIEYTEKGNGPEQIRKFIFSPRTYKKTLVHYRSKEGKEFKVLINQSDAEFEKEVQKMEDEGNIVKISEPEIVSANIKYDFAKMLLELASVGLPTVGLFWVCKSKKSSVSLT